MDLKQQITIPGTKKKVPVVGVLAVGAAGIAAYVLLKGGGSSDTSAPIEDNAAAGDESAAAGASDPYAALEGAIENISQQLADLEAQFAGGQPSSGADVPGAATSAPPPADIPLDDVTRTHAEMEHRAALAKAAANASRAQTSGSTVTKDGSLDSFQETSDNTPAKQAAPQAVTPPKAPTVAAKAVTPPKPSAQAAAKKAAAPISPTWYGPPAAATSQSGYKQ